ncbi:chromosome segregation protein SMC, partial [Candidatus Micrarchaeota archaeon]|nr:chromosome segregation protein SMC [Candidatus Micrarchaeota archaeon]
PNGSGKSNIVDALLFSFGESRLKAMRVKKIKDLIFKDHASTEVKVELIDGAAKHEIMRAVRKDGKTKYALDGKRVKKYVLEEFLAKHAVSLENIIKQGEVERIVEMSAQDRRGLIDTVANVSEYEQKKQEAFRELNQVDSKLREAGTVLKEREEYLKDLEADRQAALKFQELKKESDSLKATLAQFDLKQKTALQKTLVESIAQFEKQLSQVQSLVQKAGRSIEEKTALVEKINSDILASSEGEQLSLQRQVDELTSSIKYNSQLIATKADEERKLGEKIKEVKLELQKTSEELKGISTQASAATQSHSALKKQVAQFSSELSELIKASDAFSNKAFSSRATIEKTTEELLLSKERLANASAQEGKQSELLKVRKADLEKLSAVKQADYSKEKFKLSQLKNELEKSSSGAEKQLSDLFKAESELNKELPDLDDEINSLRGKSSEISAMLKNLSPKDFQPKLLVEALQKEVDGIHGTLDSLISYKAEFTVPVQVALGAKSNFVVVDSAKNAQAAISLVKKKNLGRVTFIPLDSIKYHAPSAEHKSLLDASGSQGFLLDKLSFDSKHAAAVNFALSNTLLVNSLENAGKLLGKTRIVTLEGELLEQNGLMTGGNYKTKINAGEQQKKLVELEKTLEEALGKKEETVSRLYSAREQISETRKKLALVQAELNPVLAQLKVVEAGEKTEEERRKSADAAADKISREISVFQKSIEELSGEKSKLSRAIADLSNKLALAREQTAVEKDKSLDGALKEKQEQTSSLKIKFAEVDNQLKALLSEKGVYEKQFESLKKQESEALASAKEHSDALMRAEELVSKHKVLLKEKSDEQKKISGKVRGQVEEKERAQKDVLKLGDQKAKLEFEKDKCDRGLSVSKIKKAGVDVQLDNAKAEALKYDGIKAITDKADEMPGVAQKSLEADKQIKALGTVNLKAVEQYDEKVSELKEKQKLVEKLYQEKESVINLINEIEGKKTSSFMRVFEAVNKNFKKLFSQIFPGDGTLYLENPEKPFDGGLTIEVKLTSKDVKYLELMSGGEKSLVALVFLFAIQTYKPTSIYILDEADAALDQENSRKLALLLNELSKESQFLVVSHNPFVYKSADCLVGVAMTKSGSKLVQVKLEEGEDNVTRAVTTVK